MLGIHFIRVPFLKLTDKTKHVKCPVYVYNFSISMLYMVMIYHCIYGLTVTYIAETFISKLLRIVLQFEISLFFTKWGIIYDNI